jgi:hypothetical protein
MFILVITLFFGKDSSCGVLLLWLLAFHGRCFAKEGGFSVMTTR